MILIGFATCIHNVKKFHDYNKTKHTDEAGETEMKNPDMFQPYIFQDNLFKASEAQIENDKMVEMVEQKLLW